MQYPFKSSFVFITFLFFLFPYQGIAQVTWIGGGDGVNWSDPANWSSNPLLPDANDDVFINLANSTVQINTLNTVALSVTIANGSTLNVKAGSLNIDNQFDADGIILQNTGTINISKGASVRIENTFFDAFYINGGVGTINNAGGITVGDTDEDVIFVDANSRLIFTNQATGSIQTPGFSGGDFIFVDENALDNSVIINHGLLNISSVFDVFHLHTNLTMDNYGTINANFIGNDGFTIDTGVKVINHPTGIISIRDTDGKSIDLDGSATFQNDGSITISQINGGVLFSTEAIDVDSKDAIFTNNGIITITGTEDSESIDIEGLFTNNGVINVGVGSTGDEAFSIDEDAQLINNECGIINITTPDAIDITLGIIINHGIITTVYAGANTSNGTFRNFGIISTPTGTIDFTGNQLINKGIINDAPIPATLALCDFPVEIPVPTLSQWGIMIFGLLLINLSTFFILKIQSYESSVLNNPHHSQI